MKPKAGEDVASRTYTPPPDADTALHAADTRPPERPKPAEDKQKKQKPPKPPAGPAADSSLGRLLNAKRKARGRFDKGKNDQDS